MSCSLLQLAPQMDFVFLRSLNPGGWSSNCARPVSSFRSSSNWQRTRKHCGEQLAPRKLELLFGNLDQTCWQWNIWRWSSEGKRGACWSILSKINSESSCTATCLNDVWMFAWVILGMTPRLENEVKRSDRSPIYNSQFPSGISRIGISSPPDSPVTIITTGWILGSSNLQSGGTRCFSGRKVFFHLKFARGGHPVKPWLAWKDSPGDCYCIWIYVFFFRKTEGNKRHANT